MLLEKILKMYTYWFRLIFKPYNPRQILVLIYKKKLLKYNKKNIFYPCDDLRIISAPIQGSRAYTLDLASVRLTVDGVISAPMHEIDLGKMVAYGLQA